MRKRVRLADTVAWYAKSLAAVIFVGSYPIAFAVTAAAHLGGLWWALGIGGVGALWAWRRFAVVHRLESTTRAFAKRGGFLFAVRGPLVRFFGLTSHPFGKVRSGRVGLLVLHPTYGIVSFLVQGWMGTLRAEYWVSLVRLRWELPTIELVPRNALTRPISATRDIEFESADFNAKWIVMCGDLRYAHALLSPHMIERLLRPGADASPITIQGANIFTCEPCSGHRPEDKKVMEARRLVLDLACLIPEHVRRSYGQAKEASLRPEPEPPRGGSATTDTPAALADALVPLADALSPLVNHRIVTLSEIVLTPEEEKKLDQTFDKARRGVAATVAANEELPSAQYSLVGSREQNGLARRALLWNLALMPGFGVVAVIYGHLALRAIRRRKARNLWTARVGLALGYATSAFWLVVLIAAVVTGTAFES